MDHTYKEVPTRIKNINLQLNARSVYISIDLATFCGIYSTNWPILNVCQPATTVAPHHL